MANHRINISIGAGAEKRSKGKPSPGLRHPSAIRRREALCAVTDTGIKNTVAAPRPPAFETLIITTTTACNLNCVYCHNKPYFNSVFPGGYTLDKDDFLHVCREYFSYLTAKGLTRAQFCFSGGEPLSLGIGFYETLFQIQKKALLETKNTAIRPVNLIQTNGLLLDKKWTGFLKRNNVKVGLSVDGPGTIQNKTRPLKDTGGSFGILNEKVDLLRAEKVRFGFLTVVSGFNKNAAGPVMDWLISKNPGSIAFIPCLDYEGAVNAKDYGEFLSTAFERWIALKKYDIRVRNFHFAFLYFLGSGRVDLPCENAGGCPCTININLNGDIYVCDAFMGNHKGYLGNLKKTSLLKLEKSAEYGKVRDFVSSLPALCGKCEYLPICNGGCFYRRLNGRSSDYLCSANKKIFSRVKQYAAESLLNTR